MALKYYTEQNIKNIAKAIRTLEGVSETAETKMRVGDMDERVLNLIWTGTQLEYDAIASTPEGYSDTTLYIIFEDN